jgi:hypothetical protein
VPRAGHGKVRLADGLMAIVRNQEAISARDTAKSWTDDAELQRVITWALMLHGRGYAAKLEELAEPELHRAKARRRRGTGEDA